MGISVLRTKNVFHIEIGVLARIEIYYTKNNTYKIFYNDTYQHRGKDIRYNFSALLHNKLISFFTRYDVIHSFPEGIPFHSRDITCSLYGNTINGSFVGHGGVYFTSDGVAYKLITSTKNKSWFKGNKTHLEIVIGRVINNIHGNGSKPTLVVDSSKTYLLLTKALLDKKQQVAIGINGVNYPVSSVEKVGEKYVINIEDFGSINYSMEQLERYSDMFVVIEEVKTIITKKLV